jgi:hypothetical protein
VGIQTVSQSENSGDSSVKYKITYGGWYQRTTLHLSEIYELFELGTSRLDLSSQKLKAFHKGLSLDKVVRKAGFLEYVEAVTKDGIIIKYYEDGLYTLVLRTKDIQKGRKKLIEYYNEKMKPAVDYIFSLGAPTPKILANIKQEHPTVVQVLNSDHANYSPSQKFGDVYSKISSQALTVYKLPQYIFVVHKANSNFDIDALIEMQIFFREFKDQLEKYLNIHRKIWELISEIKKKKRIKGENLNQFRDKLDSYETTVSLITNRINQMETYVDTRADIAQSEEIEKYLITLFQYKFSVLLNTLDYIKEVWRMTSDYLQTAIEIIVEINSKLANSSIKSLRLITTIGVVGKLFRYVKAFPEVSWEGLLFLVFLILATYIVEWFIGFFNKKKTYTLNFKNKAKDL